MRAAMAALLLLLAAPGLPAERIQAADLKPLVEVMELVQNNYAGDRKFSNDDMANAALSGMVSGLDRYSEFLDQQGFKDMKEDTRGSFGGVGIEIGIVSGKLRVIAPIEGTPADKEGLQGGDHIAQVDGVQTDGMKIMDAVHRIKGPPGTRVTLTIIREGSLPRDVVIKRAIITPVNIRWRLMDDVGYATIRSFSEKTAERLKEALKEFASRRVKGVILDLRGNPGGLLAEAVKVVDLFLPGGRIIVSTEGRDATQNARYYSTEKTAVYAMPLVVLTNEQSASGSEIVAGALKDWGRAVIMGRRSFGKASVQSIQSITRDESKALRITVARYYTPKHNEIHEVGIEPDVTLAYARVPAFVRRLYDANSFNAYASALGASATTWVDAAALREGKLAPPPRGETPGEFDRRLLEHFVEWSTARDDGVRDDEWDEGRDEVLQQIRAAVMRKYRGEEEARKLQVEADPQVKMAAAMIRQAAGAGGGRH